jgi:DNA (cytosine-5)-methyltransferase 1
VVGIDINPQPRYPFEFHQADALEYGRKHGAEFDVIHASPECQGYSSMTPNAKKPNHARQIPDVRVALRAVRRPYVIENVTGARRELINPIKLCGSMFGLPIFRHRYFEVFPSSLWMLTPPCCHDFKPVLITDNGGPNANGPGKPRRRASMTVKRAAIDIDWITNSDELSLAVPPAYTEYIGRFIMEALA